MDLTGLNVTIPYKVEILDFLDELDPASASIGAVNCVKISRKGGGVKLKGYNTDAAAFEEILRSMLKGHHRKALVMGTGGSARAVCHALKGLNLGYMLVSRQKRPGFLDYSELSHQIIGECHLVINTTPVGMYPDISLSPALPFAFLTDQHLVCDLIYNPEETLLLQKSREAGAEIKNGLEMLQLQAEMSWKIWNSI